MFLHGASRYRLCFLQVTKAKCVCYMGSGVTFKCLLSLKCHVATVNMHLSSASDLSKKVVSSLFTDSDKNLRRHVCSSRLFVSMASAHAQLFD